MILEVNNTFDERHIYLLKGSAKPVPTKLADDVEPKSDFQNAAEVCKVQLENGAEVKSNTRFTDTWSKRFHVSPFSSRKGGYSLSAHDPLGQGKVNNTITLGSSKGHPKLVARIFSTDDAVNAFELADSGTLHFIALWRWVGFSTLPRTIFEAAKLFFRRKLHVWYRPEVLRGSIARHETEDEMCVSFRCLSSPFILILIKGD